ncbi:M64 family metallopeptidase [Streptomyces phaeochromogenes]|uniref:hypothetical protein n=1 Tax=Streptomyces phaeochromogenes TaxID=1923 RepID=UPI003870DDA0|nr:M64 family metallopeptidase [Streptomyces phaeochromogenes]
MTLVGLRWADASAGDIHLVPGLASPEFFRLLLAQDSTAAGTIELKRLFNMPGLTTTFTEQLNGTGLSHGVPVVADTGEVTVQTAAMNGRSLILNVLSKQGADSASTRVRVHVHNAIQRMWLTPSHLTVRRNAKGVRFSVLAQFDDGVIGDITNWSPFETPGAEVDHTYVHAPGSDTPALVWSASAGSPITVDRQTGVLTASADVGQATITARFDAGRRSTDDAIAVCSQPWTTSVRLTHVRGPGVAKADTVPNILFLPDGFQEADRAQYERWIRLIVKRLDTRPRTRPFAALTGRVNYWQGWVPSPDAGITVLNEVEPDPTRRKGAVDQAHGVPKPSEIRPAAGWTLPDLINAVGLPNPAADPVGSPLGPKIAEWRNLYGPFVTAALVQPVYPAWLALNDRLLLNERDTAFHMTFSERPALAGDSVDHAVASNPRRLTDDDFNVFLDALRGPRGELLGTTGRLWTTGKDKNLVVVVSRSSHSGGVTSGRRVGGGLGSTLGLSLADRPFHQVLRNVNGNGFDLKPDDIPSDVFYSPWLTTAHELGHAFTLGDEYGGIATAPSKTAIIQSADEPNVQDRASLVVGGSLDVSRIKWADWPRIAKAGVLAAPPVPNGGNLTVTLLDVVKSRLSKDDIVKFRRRPLATAGQPSAICRVLSVDADRGQVVVAPLFGAVIDPNAFPAGSILLAYVRKPDPDFRNNRFGGLLTLADPEVLQRIVLTGNPLNAEPLAGEAPLPNDAPGRPEANVELPVPTKATNFPARTAPKPPPFSSWTIGLYENGRRHNTGFFRPTGVCLMSVDSQLDARSKPVNMYDFCLVCRYAFIDTVDPTLHGQVESDFIARYGKQGAQ